MTIKRTRKPVVAAILVSMLMSFCATTSVFADVSESAIESTQDTRTNQTESPKEVLPQPTKTDTVKVEEATPAKVTTPESAKEDVKEADVVTEVNAVTKVDAVTEVDAVIAEALDPDEVNTEKTNSIEDDVDTAEETQVDDAAQQEADAIESDDLPLAEKEDAEIMVASPIVMAESGSMDVTLNDTNFPDEDFRNQLVRFDINRDGVLSQSEIDLITALNINSNVKDLTGIKLLSNLITLTCYSVHISDIDVSGMANLVKVNYGSTNLKTLDFRNCFNLEIGWHSTRGETVYISAGMTKYIGCDAIPNHTGNIVIDLAGFYTVNADGSKSVDLTTVLSPALLAVLAIDNAANPHYNSTTNILTIPAGEGTTILQAGRLSNNTPSNWTFYTALNAINDCVIVFDSKGGSVVDAQIIVNGGTADKTNTITTKDGHTFDNWYLDEEYQTLFDFATPIYADLKVYAKWLEYIEKAKEETPEEPKEEPKKEPEEEPKEEIKIVKPIVARTVVAKPKAATNLNTTPQTGDTTNMFWLITAIMSLSCVIVLGVSKKKKFN